MVECRECRHPVSDAARVCPSCGVDAPGTGAVIRVTRRKQAVGSIMQTLIEVDGRVVGVVSSGGTVDLPVAAGQHLVRLGPARTDAFDATVTVDVDSGELVTVDVQLAALGMRPVVQVTRGGVAPDPSATTERWAPDPTDRHQLRYWDGSRWTDHVSDDGTTSHDPV